MVKKRLQDGNDCERELLRLLLADSKAFPEGWQRWKNSYRIDTLVYPTKRLLPPLYEKMRRVPELDPTALRFLKAFYIDNLSRAVQLETHAARVVALFAAAGMKLAVLKGAALNLRYAIEPGIRYVGDFDLFIPKNNAESAVAQLQALGWVAREAFWQVDRRILALHSVEMNLRTGIDLDLHWHVFQERLESTIDTEYFRDAALMSFAGVDVSVPSGSALFLHNLINGMRASTKGSHWVYDAWVIGEKENWQLDWQWILHLGRNLYGVSMLKESIPQLVSEYQFPIDPSVLVTLQRLRPKPVERLGEFVQTQRADGILGGLWFRVYHYARSNASRPWFTHPHSFYRYLKKFWRVETAGEAISVAAKILLRGLRNRLLGSGK